MTDGIDLLVEDHRAIASMFERYRLGPDDALAHAIFDRLTLHTLMEEQALYPLVRRIVDGGDDIADEAETEHAAVKLLIARALATPPPDLRPLVEELARNVAAHVEFEERDLLPPLRDGGADVTALADALEQARASVPDGPRPV